MKNPSGVRWVHTTCTYVPPLEPEEARLHRLPPRKDYHARKILQVVPITTHTHVRLRSAVGWLLLLLLLLFSH